MDDALPQDPILDAWQAFDFSLANVFKPLSALSSDVVAPRQPWRKVVAPRRVWLDHWRADPGARAIPPRHHASIPVSRRGVRRRFPDRLFSAIVSVSSGAGRHGLDRAGSVRWKRKGFSEGQIIAILREDEAVASAADLCRKRSMSNASFYTWKPKYGG